MPTYLMLKVGRYQPPKIQWSHLNATRGRLPSNRYVTYAYGGAPVWILKRLVVVFINACRLLSALPSLSQFGRGRLSLVAISFYTLSLHFGPCRLSEFTLARSLGLKVAATLYKNFLPRVPLQTQINQWKWHPLLWIILLCLFNFHSTRCMDFRCSRYFKFERTN